MRIVCPNCGAQYEVDAALIPAPGREVQCSNCGRGWFQAHGVEAEAEPEAELPSDPAPAGGDAVPEDQPDPEPEAEPASEYNFDPDPEPEPEPEPAPEAVADVPEPREPEAEPFEAEIARMVRADTEADPEPDAASDARAEPEPEPEPASQPEPEFEPEPETPDRPLVDTSDERPTEARHDPETLSVLREEAERELAARRRERESLEVQQDLGIDAAEAPRPAPAPAPAPPAAEEVAARKDLLPDIDEINSSLSPETTVAIANSLSGHADDALLERRRGFRLGFGTMVLAAAVLILTYLLAPWLARTFPGAEVFLISYVDWANGVRDWIDGLLAAGVDRMS